MQWFDDERGAPAGRAQAEGPLSPVTAMVTICFALFGLLLVIS